MTANTSENIEDFVNRLSHTYAGNDKTTAHHTCAFVVCLNVFEMRPSNSQSGFAAAYYLFAKAAANPDWELLARLRDPPHHLPIRICRGLRHKLRGPKRDDEPNRRNTSPHQPLR